MISKIFIKKNCVFFEFYKSPQNIKIGHFFFVQNQKIFTNFIFQKNALLKKEYFCYVIASQRKKGDFWAFFFKFKINIYYF
jgi:hypothetical protein